MTKDQFKRLDKLYGQGSSDILASKKVLIFGLGGVGSFCAEALVRSGIGYLTMVDPDSVDITNLNRQIQATHKSVGRSKIEVLKERFLDINPELEIKLYKIFYDESNQENIDFSDYDYVVDAIDSVRSKMLIIQRAYQDQIPVISSMGAGNKLDASRFRISDISKTSVCPLARVIRRNCKDLGINKLKVAWSDEPAIKVESEVDAGPGSNAFVPSSCGLLIAGEIVNEFLRGELWRNQVL